MMQFKLPIGYDDFGKIIDNKLNFVDKTLFIKSMFEDTSEVTLITRPRRFGKTLNLSMLHHFLAAEVHTKKTAGMFAGLKIESVDNGKYMQLQGTFPVIFISFKDVRADNYDLAYAKLRGFMAAIFEQFRYLKHSEKLSEREQEIFRAILNEKADQAQIENSLQFLTAALFKQHGKKVWLLIDEYDTPIQAGYLSGYYEKIVCLMRSMFGVALKTNPNLEHAVITGVLRVAKESLFSGLNNINVYSLLSPEYSQYFGFTEDEVSELLIKANLEQQLEEIKKWYNGYVFGNTIIYNPWSIVSCVNKRGALMPYWINTSDNGVIKKLLIKSPDKFKACFETLLQGNPFEAIIDENVVFGDLINNSRAAISLMLMSGYLKVIASQLAEEGTLCQLEIPNEEVRRLYLIIIKTWLANGNGALWYNEFLENLLNGNITELKENLEQILFQTVSVHDVGVGYSESFYHGLMLGLAASLSHDKYELKSNRESGLGRYDILIIPKDLQKPAVILELKKVVLKKPEKKLEKLLDKTAKAALKQINKNGYDAEIKQRGITKIIKIGLAFCGKEIGMHAKIAR